MPFEFVDNNAVIDRAARRRIRSHVAKGRNAGKTLDRPSRKKAFGQRIKTSTDLIRIPKLVENEHGFERSEEVIPEIERQVDDGLSVVSFPEQLTPGSRRLFRRAFSFISGPRYPPELSNAIDTLESPTSMWVQFMFLDEAYFHCAVAVSITALNNLVVMQEDPMEAMHHLSHAFPLVNKKLSGNDALSDTTIAVVVILSQYERLQGQYHQGLVHLKGLQRMVELRGGMFQFTRNRPALAQKIFRADLEYSLHLGSATRFSMEEIALGRTAIVGITGSFRRQHSQNLPKALDTRLLTQLGAGLQTILEDITNLAWMLNDASARDRPKLNGYKFHETLLLLGYRLIHISPLGEPRPTNRLENAVHLGLTGFIVTLLVGLDFKIMYNPLLSELARSAAQEPFDNEQEDQEVLLWLLFIGGASIFQQPYDAWLIPKTAQTMLALGLHTWEDVRRTLAKFPWVSAVHDKTGQWLRATSHVIPAEEINSELIMV